MKNKLSKMFLLTMTMCNFLIYFFNVIYKWWKPTFWISANLTYEMGQKG